MNQPMGSLLTHVLPLAAGAAISPTIMTLSVLILGGPHGKARQTVFTVVNVSLMCLLGVFGTAYMAHAADRHKTGKVNSASVVVDVTLGIVLLLLAIREHYSPAKDTEQDSADEAGKSTGIAVPKYAALGVVMTLTNFTTLALFAPALKEIAISKQPQSTELVVGLILVVIATVTAWLPLLLTVLVPGPAERILGSINHFTTTYKHQIVQVVMLVFGAYLLTKGLTRG